MHALTMCMMHLSWEPQVRARWGLVVCLMHPAYGPPTCCSPLHSHTLMRVSSAPGEVRKSQEHMFLPASSPTAETALTTGDNVKGESVPRSQINHRNETPHRSPCSTPSTATAAGTTRLSPHQCSCLQQPSCKSLLAKQAHKRCCSPSQALES